MKYFTIKDEKRRFVFSVRAINAFYDSLKPVKNDKGEVIEVEADNGMQEVLNWAYTGFKFGAKAENVQFDLSKDQIESALDEDFDMMCEIAAYCRNQLKKFQEAVAGNFQPNGQDKEVKKKVIS